LSERPVVNLALCDDCGLCAAVCYQGGLVMAQGKLILVAEVECDWCAECEAVCPQHAISCAFEIVYE